jgi:hypothetical protein
MFPAFAFSGMAVRLIAVAFVLGAAFVGGYKVAANACQAAEADRLRAAEAERRVDESFTQGVSAAYEQVAAQLRRITTVNRVEVQRETTRIEYRCPLPEPGRVLLNAAIDAANAAAGQPDPAVPADPAADGQRPGRTGERVFGADGDVR